MPDPSLTSLESLLLQNKTFCVVKPFRFLSREQRQKSIKGLLINNPVNTLISSLTETKAKIIHIAGLYMPHSSIRHHSIVAF